MTAIAKFVVMVIVFRVISVAYYIFIGLVIIPHILMLAITTSTKFFGLAVYALVNPMEAQKIHESWRGL